MGRIRTRKKKKEAARKSLIITDSVDFGFQLQNNQLRIQNISSNPFLDCHEVTFVENGADKAIVNQ